MKATPQIIWLLCFLLSTVISTPASIKEINRAIDKVNAKAALDNEIAESPPIKVNKDVDSIEQDINDANRDKEEEPLEESIPDINLPEYLNLDNFDQTTSEKLTLVEFFSPYCSHCLALAPIWEKTYKKFHAEMKTLNIDMRQVNCIESGDLCEREEIFAWPNIRLYSPERDRKTGEFKENKSKFVDSFPRSLTRTEDNIVKFLKNSVAEFNTGSIDLPSASTLISVDEVLRLITGENEFEQPVFITFFPSSDKQWSKTEEIGKSQFDKNCLECLEYKQTWDKLSNHIISIVRTGHFNCLTNPIVCEKLGFSALTSVGRRSTPKAVMFLPKSAGVKKFVYNGEVNVESMKKWSQKLYQNSQYEIINAAELNDVMEFRKNLPFEPLNSYYPLNNKISVVFYYDPDTVTEEDRSVLPYLLEEVTNSPFNINLYTAKHLKIERNMQTQAENLIEFINYDEKATPKKFDKSLYLATTLTTKPTILVFKDNTLFSSVFQSFAPEDLRDGDKISDFIKQNQYPLYQELKPELLKHYFDEKNTKTKSHKVVVNFINSENADRTNKELYNMSIIAHEYHYLKQQYHFKDLTNKREEKYNAVQKLKEQNAKSVEIIKAMRKEIPHLFQNDEVLFTFIDLAVNNELADDMGWNITKQDYKPGDSIIISKDDRYYWNTNLNGERLTNDPFQQTPVLQYLLDPKLVDTTKNKKLNLKQHLVGTPYGDYLRFMDYFHDRGFFGYLEFIIGVYLLFLGFKKLMARRKNSRASSKSSNQGLGILGTSLSKKD